ncbi:MAG: hypothetical protein Q7T71_00005, partial [Herbiconiux sp.]|nr:hypothetical protein [Herbiconiux sp.]
ACAPVLWSLTDLLLTGEPLFSLTYTSKSAGELLHRLEPAEAPEAAIHYVVESLKWPVAAACALGAVLAVWREPRRSWIPLVLVACGLGSFLILTVGGFAAIARYLAISSLVALVFGGYLLAGWTRLEPGPLRSVWLGAAAVAALIGGGFALTHTSTASIRSDLDVRERVPQRLTEVLTHPEVVAARRCGPVSLPNQKLISDVRLLLGNARASEVVARSDPRAADRIFSGGVAITITSRRLGWHPAYVPTGQGRDSPWTQFPPTGFRQVIDNGWFAGYVRC